MVAGLAGGRGRRSSSGRRARSTVELRRGGWRPRSSPATRAAGGGAACRDLLTAERTALNLLCHLSGIATLTRRWVDAVEGTGARIRDTRKTTPGLRALREVRGALRRRGQPPDVALGRRAGQGQPRRRGRRGRGGVRRRCAQHVPGVPVEVECDTVEQVPRCIEAGADLVLLDNMSPGASCARAVELARGPRPARGVRRADARARPATSPRPASTTSRSARSRIRRRYSTSAGPARRSFEDLMLLTIDIGNTNTVLGVFDGDEIVELVADLAPTRARTADETRVALRGPAGRHAVRPDRRHRGLLDRAVACCTRCGACARATTRHAHGVVEPGMRTGVPMPDGQPEGGRRRPDHEHARGPSPVRRPVHRRRLRHVHQLRRRQRARRIPRRRARAGHRDLARRARRPRRAAAQGRAGRAARAIGKNTVEALQSGILYGFAGQVDGMVGPHGRRARRTIRRT